MTLTVREALLAFRRAPLLSALSVTTIAFSLFVLGLFGLVAVNLRQALHRVAVTHADPANAGRERLAILRALGAELTLTDPSEGSDGARQVASELARQQPDRFIYLDQYDHPANWRSHFESTGPEVVAQTAGRLTHFVAGLGTTGTIVGTGRYLHQAAPGVSAVGSGRFSPPSTWVKKSRQKAYSGRSR